MSGARAVVALALLAAAGACAAAREPVLKSVKAPHSYYWRELYLPQLTSGPSAAAFSPDGTEVVYSMAGSLWRQRIGSDEAVELTHGPGYDFQPDWSRDGRWVVFTRQHGDALELQLLDLQAGTARALTTTGAVNVEPRFAPDGTRLAFVSTRGTGLFNVWVAGFDAGVLRDASALLPPRDSKVNRYYYAPTDHAINPSWTPDGRQLLLVSNNEVAWGTGDLWRVPLADPAGAQRILREESSWAARPELAPDGRRLLYSSYHGRQWHQLWLTNLAGESPMPLTFGEFDRRQARWSPDGKRVLYISNEHGNTELWVQDVAGGARTRVAARQRKYERAMADLPLVVRDDSGHALAARMNVLAADGRHYGPADAWLHADDSFDRGKQQHEDHYFHCEGECRVTLPVGDVRLRVQHGLAHRVLERTLTVAAGQPVFEAVLVANPLPASFGGWTSADLHVHMNYGGHYRNDPASLARQARAEGLDVVYNLVVNKEQRVTDIASYTTAPFHAAGITILHGQEYHTSYWGHLGLLHLSDHFLTPDFTAYRHSGFASPWPHNGVVADLAHAQGALVGYVHPYDWHVVPEKEKTLTHQFPADVVHGKVDYFEVVSFSDPLATDEVWHRLLNLGYRVPAGAGTDAMANYASLRGPLGTNRIVLPGGGLAPSALASGIRKGRGFVTNAPLLGLRVDGAVAGDTLKFDAPRRVGVTASVRSIVPLDHIELLVNGDVAHRWRARNGRDGDFATKVKFDRSGWVALRAWNRDTNPLVADLFPYGHTNPVWIEVADRPARSPDDAAYFVRWMDRVIADATARTDWLDAAERDGTLEYLQEARAEFVRRAEER
jgi:Tol biopolymer transport system component